MEKITSYTFTITFELGSLLSALACCCLTTPGVTLFTLSPTLWTGTLAIFLLLKDLSDVNAILVSARADAAFLFVGESSCNILWAKNNWKFLKVDKKIFTKHNTRLYFYSFMFFLIIDKRFFATSVIEVSNGRYFMQI